MSAIIRLLQHVKTVYVINNACSHTTDNRLLVNLLYHICSQTTNLANSFPDQADVTPIVINRVSTDPEITVELQHLTKCFKGTGN